MLAARANYPGPSLNVYPQLVKKEKLSARNPEFQILNDAFILAIIQHMEGNYVKILSIEVVVWMWQLEEYYILFRAFTYSRVSGCTIYPRKLL